MQSALNLNLKIHNHMNEKGKVCFCDMYIFYENWNHWCKKRLGKHAISIFSHYPVHSCLTWPLLTFCTQRAFLVISLRSLGEHSMNTILINVGKIGSKKEGSLWGKCKISAHFFEWSRMNKAIQNTVEVCTLIPKKHLKGY